MSFHDVRFPVALSIGSSGGPERRTEIVTLSNGFEERNSPWTHSRRRYDAGVGVHSLDDLAAVLAFFEARRGQLYAFRWKDWADFKSCLPSATPSPRDQRIGTGDGTRVRFSLVKRYELGDEAYVRPITKPVAGTVRIAVGGIERSGADVSIDANTGLVTFTTAPAKDALVTAGFEFDVPVRFDTDQIAISHASFLAGSIPAVPVVEVRV